MSGTGAFDWRRNGRPRGTSAGFKEAEASNFGILTLIGGCARRPIMKWHRRARLRGMTKYRMRRISENRQRRGGDDSACARHCEKA